MMRNRSTVKVQPGLFLQPFVVAQLTGAVIEQVVEGSEVTASEYAVTSWLNIVGRATPTELARDLGLAPTTLSAMIERLVRKGQVRKVGHPADGRSYVLDPTAKGRATNARNGRRFAAALRRLRAHLDGDPEEILDAMRRLEEAARKALEKTEEPA
jgi:DNA-binding MarR family transcriptional regulator